MQQMGPFFYRWVRRGTPLRAILRKWPHMRSGDFIILNSSHGVLVGMVIKRRGPVTHTNHVCGPELFVSLFFPLFLCFRPQHRMNSILIFFKHFAPIFYIPYSPCLWLRHEQIFRCISSSTGQRQYLLVAYIVYLKIVISCFSILMGFYPPPPNPIK